MSGFFIADEAGARSLAAWLFTLAAYAGYLLCVFHALAGGSRTEPGRSQPYRPIALLLAFTFGYWLVESWALFRAPYYAYAAAFPDGIATANFAGLGVPSATRNACTVLVQELGTDTVTRDLPFGVVALEASLTYAALATARKMRIGSLLQPLFTGMVVLVADLLLDPILASKHDCLSGALMPSYGHGVGLWHWYTDPRLTLHLFGVPLYNYAAWLCAPILLVSGAQLAGHAETTVRFGRAGLAALMLASVLLCVVLIPGRVPLPFQALGFGAALTACS